MLVFFYVVENTLFLARPKWKLLSILLRRTWAYPPTIKKDLNGYFILQEFLFPYKQFLACEKFLLLDKQFLACENNLSDGVVWDYSGEN